MFSKEFLKIFLLKYLLRFLQMYLQYFFFKNSGVFSWNSSRNSFRNPFKKVVKNYFLNLSRYCFRNISRDSVFRKFYQKFKLEFLPNCLHSEFPFQWIPQRFEYLLCFFFQVFHEKFLQLNSVEDIHSGFFYKFLLNNFIDAQNFLIWILMAAYLPTIDV